MKKRGGKQNLNESSYYCLACILDKGSKKNMGKNKIWIT